jgi:serine/threonine-protein kinase
VTFFNMCNDVLAVEYGHCCPILMSVHQIYGWQEAIEHFDRARQADASFAPAYSGLALSYIVGWGWNALPFEGGLEKGKATAKKALQMDPGLASGHLAMGGVYIQEMDHVNAERELLRALELNPNDPLAW